MTTIRENISAIRRTLPAGVTLICVSKFNPVESIREAYSIGERDFGESHVQELLLKHEALPSDIRWHMIGHLQTNKVRAIVPFIHLIQSVDSIRLMQTIQKESARISRTVDILLEVHVAREEAKSGFLPEELPAALEAAQLMPNINIRGLMGMATQTKSEEEIRHCFSVIRNLAKANKALLPSSPILSMGMSGDYLTAIAEGSNMVRIGSTIFGERDYSRKAPIENQETITQP